MKRNSFLLTTLVTLCVLVSCQRNHDPDLTVHGVDADGLPLDPAQVERGSYLVTVMLCNDCHSPKMMEGQSILPDPKRLLSGHPAGEVLPAIADSSILQDYVLFSMGFTAAVGPWGTSYAANLTPDQTGLGNWTYEHFETALRHGKFKGMMSGRSLLPPMPWEMFQHLNDQDMRAIWSYLQSLPPVQNVVPPPVMPIS
ncbi:MAG: c-type cytochrome [Saprospiraceae bacterium]|nr:c-type cytochrome [Saprospiraceae bacterium]